MSRETAAARRARLHAPPSAEDDVARAPRLPFVAEAFRRELQAWYRHHARELPWRGVRNPYATWLSEIMLQQTRVATVIDRYSEFLRRFPDLRALAEANEDDVLALWSGLGYYRRARMLHRGAQFVVREFEGKLPRSAAELRVLPGVGEYTAAAIASIAFGESVAVLDGNVERVLLRVLGLAEDRSARARAVLLSAARMLVPASAKRRERSNPPGDHNQAMMELGATICLPRQPLCLECPVLEFCKTRGEHATAERGKPQSRMVAHLLALRKRGATTEVLLERRAADATLMPGMLELPPLPLDAVEGREPALRLRHSITNTSYYVQIFAESAPGAPAEDDLDVLDEEYEGPLEGQDAGPQPAAQASPAELRSARLAAREQMLRAVDGLPNEFDLAELALHLTPSEGNLLQQVPARADSLEWTPVSHLRRLPLTGLARKTLQRLGVMNMPKLRLP